MTTNLFWQFDRNPEGSNFAGAFSLPEEKPQPLAEGKVLVRVAG